MFSDAALLLASDDVYLCHCFSCGGRVGYRHDGCVLTKIMIDLISKFQKIFLLIDSSITYPEICRCINELQNK
jgi:hypothetical protein